MYFRIEVARVWGITATAAIDLFVAKPNAPPVISSDADCRTVIVESRAEQNGFAGPQRGHRVMSIRACTAYRTFERRQKELLRRTQVVQNRQQGRLHIPSVDRRYPSVRLARGDPIRSSQRRWSLICTSHTILHSLRCGDFNAARVGTSRHFRGSSETGDENFWNAASKI